ncbi:unnamed protein product, partial [Adineta ricciae]
TLISAFAVFCCGKHAYEKNIVACLYNLLAAILQSATIFLLVGWIWSVRWGILFVQLSGNKNMSTQSSTPFYVRRQSSVDTHTQPFLTQMVAPRVPPVLEDTNEMDAPYGYLSSIDAFPNFDESVINYSTNQRSQKPSNLICKIVLVGDVAVGKSCLATRLCHNTFERNYKATIGVDFEVEKFLILGVPMSLQIWDTAGQERFKCIAAAYYRGAHAIIAVFDMNDLDTLKSAERWANEALQTTANDNPLIYLVGSKRDLLADERTCVKIEQTARVTAKRLNAEFWSVSSLTGSYTYIRRCLRKMNLLSGQRVQEFFKRIACVSYQMLVKQQLTPLSTSNERVMPKTQLAVSLVPMNGKTEFQATVKRELL